MAPGIFISRIPALRSAGLGVLMAASAGWSYGQTPAPEPLAGAVKLSDIKIQKTFERTRLTKENFGAFASACLPTYPESAKDRFLAEWRLPLTNSTIILAHNKSAGFIQIASDMGICVRESENRYPILAIESFKSTANPENANEQATEELYSKIAYTLAERGYADVAFIFKQGNVQQVTYKVDRNEKGQLSYLDSFRKKEFFQPLPGGLTYELSESDKFTITRTNGRVAKPIFEPK